jgi:hypothetical protein
LALLAVDANLGRSGICDQVAPMFRHR